MNSTINFLFESGISLSLLACVYILFLRKETFFRLNRLFLLSSIIFSIILPLLKIRVYEPQSVLLPEVTVTPYRNLIETVTVYGQDFSVSIEQAILSINLLIWIYILGTLFFSIRLLIRIFQLYKIIHKHQIKRVGSCKIVKISEECSPFSFMNYIFISESLNQTPGYKRMIAHELEHVRQGHTVDLFFLEILFIIQWFNPFMWILFRVIRENHEYLADRAVLNQGTDITYYKKLLINQVAGGQLILTNNFNYSLIKNRIKMMSKIKSSKLANIKIFMGIIVAATLIVAFACEKKDSINVPTTEENNKLSLTIVNDKLKIEGEDADIDKLKRMFVDTKEFSFKTDSTGNLFLVKRVEEKIINIDKDDPVFHIVEQMPEFPGGEDALREFLGKTVDYPKAAQESNIEGTVFITFIVNKDGNVSNARVVRGVDPILDKEALRVVNKLPKWEPGLQKGKPVNVSFTVPINFSLK